MGERVFMHQRTYELEFTEDQWEEVVNLGFEPFEITAGESLTRGQWMAVADMALGKAVRIDQGRYVLEDSAQERADNAVWAAELRAIAAVILDKFQPGDGQL